MLHERIWIVYWFTNQACHCANFCIRQSFRRSILTCSPFTIHLLADRIIHHPSGAVNQPSPKLVHFVSSASLHGSKSFMLRVSACALETENSAPQTGSSLSPREVCAISTTRESGGVAVVRTSVLQRISHVVLNFPRVRFSNTDISGCRIQAPSPIFQRSLKASSATFRFAISVLSSRSAENAQKVTSSSTKAQVKATSVISPLLHPSATIPGAGLNR